ncbi:FCPE [Symbiodinium sp. CCMP2456]|nr:FCPE [Symbiodinium sp. CCMP2456]
MVWGCTFHEFYSKYGDSWMDMKDEDVVVDMTAEWDDLLTVEADLGLMAMLVCAACYKVGISHGNRNHHKPMIPVLGGAQIIAFCGLIETTGFFQASSTTDGRGPREGQFSMKDSTESAERMRERPLPEGHAGHHWWCEVLSEICCRVIFLFFFIGSIVCNSIGHAVRGCPSYLQYEGFGDGRVFFSKFSIGLICAVWACWLTHWHAWLRRRFEWEGVSPLLPLPAAGLWVLGGWLILCLLALVMEGYFEVPVFRLALHMLGILRIRVPQIMAFQFHSRLLVLWLSILMLFIGCLLDRLVWPAPPDLLGAGRVRGWVAVPRPSPGLYVVEGVFDFLVVGIPLFVPWCVQVSGMLVNMAANLSRMVAVVELEMVWLMMELGLAMLWLGALIMVPVEGRLLEPVHVGPEVFWPSMVVESGPEALWLVDAALWRRMEGELGPEVLWLWMALLTLFVAVLAARLLWEVVRAFRWAFAAILEIMLLGQLMMGLEGAIHLGRAPLLRSLSPGCLTTTSSGAGPCLPLLLAAFGGSITLCLPEWWRLMKRGGPASGVPELAAFVRRSQVSGLRLAPVWCHGMRFGVLDVPGTSIGPRRAPNLSFWRLHRRLAHLARVPSDTPLIRKVRCDLHFAAETFPELRVFADANPLDALESVAGIVQLVADDEKRAALRRWLATTSDDFGAQCSWVRRRCALEEAVWLLLLRRCSNRPNQSGLLAGRLAAIVLTLLCFMLFVLSLSMAQSMKGKAPGVDQWRAEELLLLPPPFWQSLAELWQSIADRGDVPRPWQRVRIALLPKRQGGTRPLSLLSVVWRLGAKHMLHQLDAWVGQWLDHTSCGGVPARSGKDLVYQLLAGMREHPHSAVVAQDLAKYFDAIDVRDLMVVLRRLAAPPQLVAVVQALYDGQERLFSRSGFLSGSWVQASRGLCQGCPLSPLLAAAVLRGWSALLGTAGARAASFVDDRYFWASSPGALRSAKEMCHRGVFDLSSIAGEVAAACGYSRVEQLTILGLTLDFGREGAAVPAAFALCHVRRRLRLVAVLTRNFIARRALLRRLVMPMIIWAGAFGVISAEDARALRQDFLFRVGSATARDKAMPLCLAVLGYECDPCFMRHWSVLQEVVRLRTVTRAWQDTAPLSVALRPLVQTLPVVTSILRELGWQLSADERSLQRRDVLGVLRSFRFGFDSRQVLQTWLADFHRRADVKSCGRIKIDYHRADQGLARGPSLPVPADPLCLFAGHHKLYGAGSLALDKLCLGHGCSAWDRQKAQRLEELPTCACGLEAPSRPHLLWACTHFPQCTAAVGAPCDRIQERLLGCAVPEWPAPPPVLDTAEVVEDLAEALRAAWSPERPWLFVATDGSCQAEVASYSVVLDQGAEVAGVEGEDQTSYKAELSALALLIRAALCLELVGTLWVVVDCKSLLDAIAGRGALGSLVMQISAGIAVLSSRGLQVKLEWVPSHGKPLPAGWVAASGASEACLRALNERADHAALRFPVGRWVIDTPRRLAVLSEICCRVIFLFFFIGSIVCNSIGHAIKGCPHMQFEGFGEVEDPEARKSKLAAELANGRLAMMAIIGMFFQDGLTGSAWGDWALYTASPLRAEAEEEAPKPPPFDPAKQVGAMAPLGFFDPAGFAQLTALSVATGPSIRLQQGLVFGYPTFVAYQEDSCILEAATRNVDATMLARLALQSEEMPAMELMAAMGLAGTEVFRYNRENFEFDQEQRFSRDEVRVKMQVELFNLFREDIRDLVEMTTSKMNLYHLVGALFIKMICIYFCEGFFEEGLPPFLLCYYYVSQGSSVVYLIMAVWLSMHASVTSHSYATRVLTRFIRLPIPGSSQLNVLNARFADFERQGRQMLRIPFLNKANNKWQDRPQLEAQREAPSDNLGDGIWAYGGLMKLDVAGYEEDIMKAVHHRTQRHIQLFRRLQALWQCYDAYARVCMSLGVRMMLQGISYYLLGICWVQINAPYVAAACVVVFQFLALNLAALDIHGVNDLSLIGALPSLCAIMALACAQRTTLGELDSEQVYVLTLIMYPMEVLWFEMLHWLASPMGDAGFLPRQFKSVLFMDVFSDLNESGVMTSEEKEVVELRPDLFATALQLRTDFEMSGHCQEGYGLPGASSIGNQSDIPNVPKTDGLTGSAWGDWATYTASPLRAEPVSAAAAAAAAKVAAAKAGEDVPPEPSFDPANEVGVTEPFGYFDPAGFCKKGDKAGFRNLRAAEIKHGRVAMMAAVGAVFQHYVKFPGFESVPAGLGAVEVAPGTYGFAALFAIAGLLELGAWTEDPSKEPGNFGDPAGLNQYTLEMRNRELNNGRMAMFAAIGIIAANVYTGKDAIEQFGLA